MFRVELVSGDFLDEDFVLVASVARAIAKILVSNGSPNLTDGSPNRVKAERNAWNLIFTGVEYKKLHPFPPETLDVLCAESYTGGIVQFSELVEWGKWCHRFTFVDARGRKRSDRGDRRWRKVLFWAASP